LKTLHTQNRIVELMSRFVAQIKGFTAMSRTDINHVSEDFLIPLLRHVYGFHDLKNLNATEGANYPGVDLGDETARVAFQITSTSEGEKVKHTLEKVIEHRLYEKYDRVIIYILTEKQKSYSAKPFDDILSRLPAHAGRFTFDKGRDILDYTDLLSKIATLPLGMALVVEGLLEENFGDNASAFFDGVAPTLPPETVHLNLLELAFPDVLFVADLSIDIEDDGEEDEWGGRRTRQSRPRRRKNPQQQVRDALSQRGLKFGVDWVCHAKQMVTFHDLRDTSLPISAVIEPGTVTTLRPDEFYRLDENHERVFKSLLGKCLQQKLFRSEVRWQNEDKLFIFSEVDGEAKRVEVWHGKRKAPRAVFVRTMKNNKPDEILICKHLAFRAHYQQYGSQWYIVITPDWFFSFDGYKRSFYGAEKIAWLKKNENNTQVFNHVRFIAYFLKNDAPSNLFVQTKPYPFLTFGELASFDNAPGLNDKDWLPGESSESKKRLQEEEGTSSLDFDGK
jgi:hypothetical protein